PRADPAAACTVRHGPRAGPSAVAREHGSPHRRARRMNLAANPARVGWALSDVRGLTRRTPARIAATPEQLLDLSIQPLIFVLLFSDVLNAAIILPGNGNSRE